MLARMVRKLQRGGGPVCSLRPNSWRASSPGPCWSRSWSSSRWSKTPPLGAAMAVGDQAGHPFGLINVQPAIETVRVAGLEQAVGRHRMRTEAVGNLEHGGGAFADIGARIVVAGVE